MYCSKCCSQNKEGSKFCKACGFSLQHVRQINQNKKQHNDVNKSIQGLGSSKDFYTYLTAILLLISVFAKLISEDLSIFLILGALVFWVIGLKKTTNLILHFALAILAFVIFITTIVNY